jgi:uncharacterized protein YbcV (DUF1398 family)
LIFLKSIARLKVEEIKEKFGVKTPIKKRKKKKVKFEKFYLKTLAAKIFKYKTFLFFITKSWEFTYIRVL